MRKRLWLGLGMLIAGLLTHGMVYSAADISATLPLSTYRGFFQHALYVIESLWSAAHGWASMSHIEDFGRFYALLVHLGCPLAGFALVLAGWRRWTVGSVWKPVAVAAVASLPWIDQLGPAAFRLAGMNYEWSEVARTALLMTAMLWLVSKETPASALTGQSAECSGRPHP